MSRNHSHALTVSQGRVAGFACSHHARLYADGGPSAACHLEESVSFRPDCQTAGQRLASPKASVGCAGVYIILCRLLEVRGGVTVAFCRNLFHMLGVLDHTVTK